MLKWSNQPTVVFNLRSEVYFLGLLQSRGDNRLWLQFRK